MAATLDDLVAALGRIADQLDVVLPMMQSVITPEERKAQATFQMEYLVKQVADMKGVSMEAAAAVVESWKRG